MKKYRIGLNLLSLIIISIFFIFLFNLSSFATCNLPGDFCGPMGDPTPDGKVDFNDLMVFATAYGSETGDPNWNALCDICGYLGDPNPDGQVNFDDLMVFATNYGKECPSEEGVLVVASAQIDLETGGIVEVTDEESEVYGSSLVIDPMTREQLASSRGLSEIAIILNAMVLGTNDIGDYQGWIVTPVGVTATEDILGSIIGKLELAYNEDKISNSGVAKDTVPNVYRVLCAFDPIKLMPIPVPGVSWKKVPQEKITHETDKVIIDIGFGDLLYLYALTVTNCAPPDPNDFGTPLPGDLLYRLSEVGVIDNWNPGHVGIYVGERYDEEDGLYNVIEALGSPLGQIGLGPDEVLRTHYEDITKFGGDQYVYMGAREPANQRLSHSQRNAIVQFLDNDNVIGKEYAFFNTVFGLWLGLARGEKVKGPDSYNCVGLAEAAYDSVGAGIVSDEDEGNDASSLFPQDYLLTPQEQLFRTVPASGIMDYNNAPVISSLDMVPENPVLGDWVTVTCHAIDQDGDELTYEWTIEDGSENIIAGPYIEDEKIDLQILLNNFLIKCTAFDNYGGEGKFTEAVNLGGTGSVHNLIQDIYYETIQAALDDVNNGDVIEVADGTYNELITFPEDKAINLQSINGPDSTIIDGSGLHGVFGNISIQNNLYSTIVKGFTISGGQHACGGGISIDKSDIEITECIINNNNSGMGGGIYANESTLTLNNCYIENNTISSNFCRGGGIYANESTLTLNNCYIEKNHAGAGSSNGGGIYSDFCTINLSSCIVAYNYSYSRAGGLSFYNCSSIILSGCTIKENESEAETGGIYIDNTNVNISITNNTLCGNTSNDVATVDNQIYPNNYPNNDISATCGGTGPYSLRDTGPAGGYIFYDKGSYSDGWRYLEAAPKSTEWTDKEWGSYESLVEATATGIGTGQNNTNTIVTWLSSHGEINRAAQLCDALVYGGYSNWFLPSKDELNLMNENLRVYGIGGFIGSIPEENVYWSSSEFNADFAWLQFFNFCGEMSMGQILKYSRSRVRAVRAF